MAWGVFTFNKEGRQRVAGVLRALLIAQLIVSLCMVIFCYNTSMKVLLLLRNIHKGCVLLLYGLILLQAYCMKLHYTSGLRLLSWFLRSPHWERVSMLSRFWIISGSCVAANGLLVYAACRCTLKDLMKELSSSLRIGISQYLTEPTWKRLLDTMQIELSCCGTEKPSDWHETPWINMDFLNEESDIVMKHMGLVNLCLRIMGAVAVPLRSLRFKALSGTATVIDRRVCVSQPVTTTSATWSKHQENRLAGADGKVLPPVSPFSCCTPRVLAACYHDPLQQAEWREVWSGGSPLPSASLHTSGCVEAVRQPLTKALLGLQLFNVLVFLFQIIIVILTQLLRRSARDAVLSGDWDGVGRGYLFGRLKPIAEQPYRIQPLKIRALTAHRTVPPRRRRRIKRDRRVDSNYAYLS